MEVRKSLDVQFGFAASEKLAIIKITDLTFEPFVDVSLALVDGLQPCDQELFILSLLKRHDKKIHQNNKKKKQKILISLQNMLIPH